MEINDILDQRQKTHGNFEKVARLDTELFSTFNTYLYSSLSDEQYCAIKMILHKIARIGCGDPEFIDHWQDIIGYAQLIINSIKDRDQILTDEERNILTKVEIDALLEPIEKPKRKTNR